MPIEQAMKQIVSSGLPVRTQSASGKVDDYAISVPSDMSSGRTTVKLK
jgi:hypothetical protein